MLQIASGKLFRGRPVHRNELRGVLYTNLRMYNQVVDTAAGRLLYTSTLHDSKSLVYEFTELIEDDPAVGGSCHMASTPTSAILQQSRPSL